MSNFNSRVATIPCLPAEKWEVCVDPRFDQYAISTKGRVWDLVVMKERPIYGKETCPLVSLYNNEIGSFRLNSVNRLISQQFQSRQITLTRNNKLVFVFKKNYGLIGNSEASAASFKNRFSEKEVHEICRDIIMGVSLGNIAKKHNTYKGRISNIKYNTAYREISKLYW